MFFGDVSDVTGFGWPRYFRQKYIADILKGDHVIVTPMYYPD